MFNVDSFGLPREIFSNTQTCGGRKSVHPIILLADDSPDDVAFARIAVERADLDWRLFPVRSGIDAIRYLGADGPYSDRTKYPLPEVILLDIKMPELDGFGLLGWLQKHPELKSIPKIVLSSSSLDSDISLAKALGADDYLVKPLSFHELISMFCQLNTRWLRSQS